MRFPGRRARISVMLSLGVAVAVLIPVLDQISFRYGWANAALQDIEGRHARLLGLRDAGPEIGAARAGAQAMLELHTYPAEGGADRVGADLQQRVRRLAESAGIGVSGSQILPVRAGDGFEIIPLSLIADGEIGPLRDFLASLESEKPSIQVDSLNISAPRQRGRNVVTDGKVRAQIQLSAIHLLS